MQDAVQNPFANAGGTKPAAAEPAVAEVVTSGGEDAKSANPVTEQPAAQPAETTQPKPAAAPPPAVAGPEVATPPAKMFAQPEGVMDLSFDSDIKIDRLEKFPKMKKDEVRRVALLLFNENGAPLIKMSYHFFDDTKKFGFLAPKNPDTLAKVVNVLGEPKIRFGTIVAVYTTDQFGNLPQQWGVDFYAYTFSTDKFPILKSLHNEWGLKTHDLVMTCAEPEFQKMSIQPGKECVLLAQNPDLYNMAIEKATELWNKHLAKFMGRPRPDQEILFKLGLAAAPGPAGAAGGVNADNPFHNAAAPAENIAEQTGTGQPAGGEFAHLQDKG